MKKRGDGKKKRDECGRKERFVDCEEDKNNDAIWLCLSTVCVCVCVCLWQAFMCSVVHIYITCFSFHLTTCLIFFCNSWWGLRSGFESRLLQT